MIEGFFGGKFMPMHKGHLYCIDTAARQCDRVVVIMFIGSDEELEILSRNGDPSLRIEARIRQIERVCGLYPNVEFHIIDDRELHPADGESSWDAETPLVRRYLPKMDYVYSSEPHYGEYFARAYPEAKHVIVDAKRKNYPISGTMIRAMKELEDKKKWMV